MPTVTASLVVLAVVVPLSCMACGGSHPSETPRVLLFTGRGTSPNDVAAIGGILTHHGLGYSTANSERLDRMSESELADYKLLVVPGGNFEEMGKGLGASTTTRLRGAIGNWLSYLGICAGAFFAGDSPYNGLDLTSGGRFRFYAAGADRRRMAAVAFSGLWLYKASEAEPQTR